MNVFDQMLSRYEIISENDRRNAIYEVMQEVTLAGLYRGGFIVAAFLIKRLFMVVLVCASFMS